jgi:hypothetical protein
MARGGAQFAACTARFELRRARPDSRPIPPSISGSAAVTGTSAVADQSRRIAVDPRSHQRRVGVREGVGPAGRSLLMQKHPGASRASREAHAREAVSCMAVEAEIRTLADGPARRAGLADRSGT